jgi:hypothetical protein
MGIHKFALVQLGVLMVGVLVQPVIPFQAAREAAHHQDDRPFKEPFDSEGNFVKPAFLRDLEERYAASRGDNQLRAELVGATYELAEGVMYRSAAPPNRKYPAALRLFRAVVALEPNHEKAHENKKIIEDIYEALGKPLPDEE